MPTYKFTIPIECSTLYRVKKKICEILWAGFEILLFVALGVLNAAVLIPSLLPRYNDPSIDLMIGSFPNWPLVTMLGVILVDLGAIIAISAVYDIHFKIDCMRSDIK